MISMATVASHLFLPLQLILDGAFFGISQFFEAQEVFCALHKWIEALNITNHNTSPL